MAGSGLPALLVKRKAGELGWRPLVATYAFMETLDACLFLTRP